MSASLDILGKWVLCDFIIWSAILGVNAQLKSSPGKYFKD